MSRSFNSHKRLISENQLLTEIFDSTPLNVNIVLKTQNNPISCEFIDEQNNNVKVLFHLIGKEIYELDFMVNGDSFENQDIKYSVKNYSKLLNTIALVVSKFLDEIHPVGLVIEGSDSVQKIIKRPKAEGQKNIIYNYFISKIETKHNYKVDLKQNGTINLIRKNA